MNNGVDFSFKTDDRYIGSMWESLMKLCGDHFDWLPHVDMKTPTREMSTVTIRVPVEQVIPVFSMLVHAYNAKQIFILTMFPLSHPYQEIYGA